MAIETDRLRLIPVSTEHTGLIHMHFTEQVTRYMVPHAAQDIRETRDAVCRFVEQRKQHADYVYAITLKQSGEFLGLAGLHHLNTSIPELGIWTKAEAHGHHYGREAIGGVIQYAGRLGIKKLCYPVDRRNIASQKIPLYYGGRRIAAYEETATPDGRILELETYEIDLTRPGIL